MDLVELPTGKSAVVEHVEGGHGVAHRLDALGLRVGKVVTKMGKQIMAGPIIIVIDGREVAMGRGIGRKVRVKPLDKKK
jgi:ferrous iron transport protein A